MKTTLNEIYAKNPCDSGWKKLLESLGKTEPDNDDLELSYILKSNGIKDALWALRCFDYLDYCLFLADVAEGVLDIYEKKYSNPAPRNAINAIRLYKSGEITKEKLRDAADAAADAAAYTAAYAADAAADAAAYTAYTAADAAAYTAYTAADAAAYTAYTAADAAADAAYTAAYTAAADAAAARKNKWKEITVLFVKFFCG